MKKKDWKNDYQQAEKTLAEVLKLVPILEKRDATMQNADPLKYEEIKSIDMTTRIYEQIKEIFNRGWGSDLQG